MQIMLNGMTLDEMTIERIKQFEPPVGYYVAFSGGKDSVVLLDLTKRSGVKFDAHYHLTTVDPPELVRFIRTFSEVEIVKPAETMWQAIRRKNMPPLRNKRWCCELFKENGGAGRTVLTGIRAAESARRANRRMVESCYKDKTKHYINPIMDWEDADVWQYIHEHRLRYCSLYDEGMKRIGCVLCPMIRHVEWEINRWPKLAAAWKRAVMSTWKPELSESPEKHWEWWLKRDGAAKKNDDSVMFE